MIEREEILAYVKEKFDTEPDYPWFKYPDYVVLIHEVGAIKGKMWPVLVKTRPRQLVIPAAFMT